MSVVFQETVREYYSSIRYTRRPTTSSIRLGIYFPVHTKQNEHTDLNER